MSYNCLDRHVERRARATRSRYHWEGEPGDSRTDHLRGPARRGRRSSPTRSRHSASRRATGSHLPGHGARAADGDARLRPDRRRALGGVRRLHRRLAPRPHQRRRGAKVLDHRRRRVAPGRHRAAQGDRRRGGGRVPDRSRRCLVLRRTENDVADDRRAATSGGTTWCPRQSAECPPEPMDAEDLLYILYTSGTTAKPKGIMHTTGGYLTQVAWSRTSTCSTCTPTPTSTGARPTSAGSPDTRTSSTGRSRTGATSVMYEGTPDHPEQGPPLGDHREVRRHDPLHRAHRDPDVHEVG